MPRYRSIALCLGLATVCAHGQQAVSTSSEVFQGNAQPDRVKVYSIGPGVTPATLLPLDLPPITAEKCKQKIDGKVDLSVIVDSAGRPRNIMFLHPLGTDADRFALQIANADQFKPGTVDGKPVAVAQTLKVKIQSCVVESKDSNGQKSYALKLRTIPVQELIALPNAPEDAVLIAAPHLYTDTSTSNNHADRVSGSTKAPIPLFQPEAEYTDAARKAKINGSCLVSLIVDPQGMPQNVRITKSLDPGLDQTAIIAVNRYRFRPAMQCGKPVPVIVTIEVTYKIW
jgi:TonB family protein